MRGRPESENPRSENLPKARLTKEENRMLKMKAAIDTNGNMSEFIRKAIEAYVPQLPKDGGQCYECGSVLKRTTYDRTFEDIPTIVKNIPGYRCQSCNALETDLAVEAEVAGLLESIFNEEKGKLPAEVDISRYTGIVPEDGATKRKLKLM